MVGGDREHDAQRVESAGGGEHPANDVAAEDVDPHVPHPEGSLLVRGKPRDVHLQAWSSSLIETLVLSSTITVSRSLVPDWSTTVSSGWSPRAIWGASAKAQDERRCGHRQILERNRSTKEQAAGFCSFDSQPVSARTERRRRLILSRIRWRGLRVAPAS